MKWKLIFMDGSTEIVDIPGGKWLAWFVGRVKAREKETYLLRVEPAE